MNVDEMAEDPKVSTAAVLVRLASSCGVEGVATSCLSIATGGRIHSVCAAFSAARPTGDTFKRTVVSELITRTRSSYLPSANFRESFKLRLSCSTKGSHDCSFRLYVFTTRSHVRDRVRGPLHWSMRTLTSSRMIRTSGSPSSSATKFRVRDSRGSMRMRLSVSMDGGSGGGRVMGWNTGCAARGYSASHICAASPDAFHVSAMHEKTLRMRARSERQVLMMGLENTFTFHEVSPEGLVVSLACSCVGRSSLRDLVGPARVSTARSHAAMHSPSSCVVEPGVRSRSHVNSRVEKMRRSRGCSAVVANICASISSTTARNS
mmetsp:Transcript_50488/g.126762  ORF Transcript_50488/g.126762 Transcript_50488/m.126762 type:complete len:320 (-) Transcript_50488:163-1122(-)